MHTEIKQALDKKGSVHCCAEDGFGLVNSFTDWGCKFEVGRCVDRNYGS